MEIQKAAAAGTMESSDIMITLEPSTAHGIRIDLASSVEKQFGDAIRAVIRETLEQHGVGQVQVRAVDKGALDCVIRARLRTAIHRACEVQQYTWGGKAP